nr:MAG TPA: hypothetical protein [Caudoviricetes sp.]DAR91504.1 MAG TPA: hypothetical protein [Caudoviricetes sp.]
MFCLFLCKPFLLAFLFFINLIFLNKLAFNFIKLKSLSFTFIPLKSLAFILSNTFSSIFLPFLTLKYNFNVFSHL